MTKTSRQQSSVAGWLVIGMMGWFVGCMQINESHGKDNSMTTKQMNLWQAIEVLAQQIPLTKAKVEALFSITLYEKRRSRHTTFLEGDGVDFSQGSQLTKFDLRLGNDANDPGFMVLSIGGACVTLEQVRNHYSALTITGSPRGRSLDDVTTHSTELPWGKLTFAFAERKPECLAWIAFDPKKDR